MSTAIYLEDSKEFIIEQGLLPKEKVEDCEHCTDDVVYLLSDLTDALAQKADGWISVDEMPVNGSYDWKIGDKAIGFGGYAFEIEWDGDCWCSIGGDDFTHWMPLPPVPTK